MGREPQEKGQGTDREDHADRPTQPTGNTTSRNTQPLRIPISSATVSRFHREDCDDSRKSQGEGHGEDREIF
eukprot:686511-Pyramimonas_sp.AAC.1